MDLQTVSPPLHWLTSHFFYKDYCKDTLDLKSEDSLYECAFRLSYLKRHDDFDKVHGFGRSFFGYDDPDFTRMPMDILRRTGTIITYSALFLDLLKIRIDRKTLLTSVFVLNFALHLPSLYMPF